MVTAPGLAIAIVSPVAGYLVARFGCHRLLLGCTFFYGIFGVLPVLLDNLNVIFATRLALGVREVRILTIVNTLIVDYWDESGRRTWLFLRQFVGTVLTSGVILLFGMVAATRWNAGFLVYLVAFPIFGAMVVYLFEPPRRMPVAVIGVAPTPHPFPLRSAAIVAAVTLLVSMLF